MNLINLLKTRRFIRKSVAKRQDFEISAYDDRSRNWLSSELHRHAMSPKYKGDMCIAEITWARKFIVYFKSNGAVTPPEEETAETDSNGNGTEGGASDGQ